MADCSVFTKVHFYLILCQQLGKISQPQAQYEHVTEFQLDGIGSDRHGFNPGP